MDIEDFFSTQPYDPGTFYDENGQEDADASRRVEFKFSLKDSEMIEELNQILSGGEEAAP